MKRKIRIFTILLLTAALALCAFGCNDNNVPSADVKVTAKVESVTTTPDGVMGYDYASLFTITEDGASVEVVSSYIDTSKLSTAVGNYTVTCTYKGVSDSVSVVVSKAPTQEVVHEYSIELSVDHVRVNADNVAAYDFNALFTLKIDSVLSPITSDMVTTNVAAAAGEYTYTVAAGDKSKTLNVTVWEYPAAEMIACYRSVEIPVNETEFDFTGLFSLYKRGKAVRVIDDMLGGVPASFEVGDKFTVTASYSTDGVTVNASVPVEIVPEAVASVSCKNITTYPNAKPIDLVTLFDITYNGEKVDVTIDMISGDVDYTTAGDNDIVLTYGGVEYTAKVTVVLGVVIEYARTDTVTVVRGTNQNTYSFGDDFIVTVNGIRFTDLEHFIDLSTVDFSTAGTYTVTLSVPYNTKPVGVTTVNFDYFEKEITYVVTDKIATVSVKDDFVSLPAGTTSYGVSKISQNVSVTLNGTPCILVANRDWTIGIDTNVFVEIISGVDASDKGDQRVVLDVYAYGVEATPVRVEYTVRIMSEISVTAHDYAVFVGGTVYNRDLFDITVNGERVEVTDNMLTGKVDVFTPGTYSIEIDYEGIIATANVTVFDHSMYGVYKTLLTKIPEAEDDDVDESGDGWGDGSDWDYYSLSVSSRAASDPSGIDDLIVDEDGITVDGKKATDVLGVSADVMTFYLGSNKFTMYLNNGIAVLDPDNYLKMPFSDYRRPLIYFSSAMWRIEKYITINSGALHVLQNPTNNGYSIDCFRIAPIGDNALPAMWFGLKTHLVERMGSDSVYIVSWGEIEFAENFLNAADYLNLESSLDFLGETYRFVMNTRIYGKISKQQSLNKYSNMTFNGTLDGKDAKLSVNATEQYTLVSDSKTIINSYGNETDYSNNMVNGGADYANDIVRLNSYGGKDGKADDGIFSYKFKLDIENKTFEIFEKDKLYGRYETPDGRYIFLDGYGEGCISFNPESYNRTRFTYIIAGNEVKLHYLDTLPTFAYGTEMNLYVAPLLNVLTVKRAVGVEFGTTYTMRRELISDGAIVSVSSTAVIAQNAATRVRDAISVVDKTGEEWDNDQKKSNIAINYVGSKSGIYLVTVKVSVGGSIVEVPYAFQVYENKFSSATIVKNYGSGTLFMNNALSMDTYGTVTMVVGSTEFKGVVTQASATGFTAKLHNADGRYLCAVGELVADGIIKVTATGATPFSDYFTTGTVRSIGRTGIGIDGLVIREFTVANQKTYIACGSTTSIGNIAQISIVDGSQALLQGTVFDITYGAGANERTRRFTVVAWNNTSDGLTEQTV